MRILHVKGARRQARNRPYVKSAPIFRPSGKSERAAISRIAAGLQAIYRAFDTGTVLRQLYPELISGHSAGFTSVKIRNGQIIAANALNGTSAIPAERKLSGATRRISEMLERCEISSLTYAQGQLGMTDSLAKSSSANALFYLSINSKCAAASAQKVKENWRTQLQEGSI